VPVLRIRQLGDPVLRERSRPVAQFDASLRRLAEDMAETMYDAPGVGLAANQIGRALRLFVWDDQSGEGWHAVTNPEVELLGGEEEYDEGCLSIPGLYFSRKRGLRVRLRGQDLDGRELDIEAEAFRARIFQHETDHLNGELFVDALEGEARTAWMRTLRERELGLSL
jgi:peptide deformylase